MLVAGYLLLVYSYLCAKTTLKGKLYLIPNLLGEGKPEDFIPGVVLSIVKDIRYFIVEDIRTARRFLSKIRIHSPIDSLTFFELNEHTALSSISAYLDPAKDNNIGVISDAGVPGVADPGADIVRLAHQKGIQVVPMVGPSSILLAMMASGLNGQNFAFNGYLPVKKPERINRIKFFERRAQAENQSQAFIETPYRNVQLFDDILASCKPSTMLCIAANISQPDEFILTLPVSAWAKQKPDLHKKPAIFILGS